MIKRAMVALCLHPRHRPTAHASVMSRFTIASPSGVPASGVSRNTHFSYSARNSARLSDVVSESSFVSASDSSSKSRTPVRGACTSVVASARHNPVARALGGQGQFTPKNELVNRGSVQ